MKVEMSDAERDPSVYKLNLATRFTEKRNDFNAAFDSVWKRTTFLEISMGLSKSRLECSK